MGVHAALYFLPLLCEVMRTVLYGVHLLLCHVCEACQPAIDPAMWVAMPNVVFRLSFCNGYAPRSWMFRYSDLSVARASSHLW
jgi:hypothetical protein